MSDTLSDFDAAAWLLWQAEMGADEAISDAHTDWFALKPETAPLRAEAPQRPQRAAPVRDMPVRRAAPAAQAPDAGDLEALRAALEASDGCGLKRTATSLCLYRGAPQADVMLIGEAPGREEDLSGSPFVGRAGQLLDRMLAAIGLDESSVHIANIVYWRPPGNRTPTPEEVEACRPYLLRQIALVAPSCILALGGPAAKSLTGASEGILRLRGRWRTVNFGGRDVPVLPTLHPAYLLRTPAAKRHAWSDLLELRRFLSGGGA
jgi:uracil-DNA glycosylase family 4